MNFIKTHRVLQTSEFLLFLLEVSLKNPDANQRGHRRRKWKRKKVCVSFPGKPGKHAIHHQKLRCLFTVFLCSYAEPSPEERLQKLHTDIKFALKVDNPVSDIYEFVLSFSTFCAVWNSTLMCVFLCVLQDIDRCLQALAELEAVPVTSQILHKNAEVIATLKKVQFTVFLFWLKSHVALKQVNPHLKLWKTVNLMS